MRIVELRSDTKTLPTPAMREGMATSQYGDDMVGDDPTVNRLETMAADMLGKEAGLLLSSGTMGNLVPILALCQRGDDIIIGDKSHIYRAEAGGASALGGVAYHPIPNQPDGTLDPAEVEANIHPADQHYSPTRLIALGEYAQRLQREGADTRRDRFGGNRGARVRHPPCTSTARGSSMRRSRSKRRWRNS